MTQTTLDPARRRLLAVGAALAALLLLTRFGHFGELSRLPDASWAVFFLGGLALRDARAFAAFFGLAWLVDVAAVAMGTPADCFSPAYLFLVPAYGTLWWAGRGAGQLLAAPTAPRRLAQAAALLPAAVGVAFVVSNAGVFLLGGTPGGLGAAQYAARVLHYLPGYLLVTLLYVGAALAAHRFAGRVVLSGRGSRDPGNA